MLIKNNKKIQFKKFNLLSKILLYKKNFKLIIIW